MGRQIREMNKQARQYYITYQLFNLNGEFQSDKILQGQLYQRQWCFQFLLCHQSVLWLGLQNTKHQGSPP